MFEPAGDRARWRIIYELLQTVPINGTITYVDMGHALNLDPDEDRHAIQMAMRRASKELEEDDLRAVDSIPNVGYRVVEPKEHLTLARRQQKRSHKALARGHSKVTHVDLNSLDPDVRHAFQVVAAAFSMQMSFNRRMDIRQARLETALRSVTEQTNQSSEQIETLKARLERLEAERQAVPPEATDA